MIKKYSFISIFFRVKKNSSKTIPNDFGVGIYISNSILAIKVNILNKLYFFKYQHQITFKSKLYFFFEA